MEINMFKNIENMNIAGNPTFTINNNATTGQKTIHNYHNTTINDHSQRTKNYGNYKNYGSHAENNGQINHDTPPSIPGKQRYPGYNPEM
jgi:hypothetical protein